MPARDAEADPVEWVRARWREEDLPEADRFATVAVMMRAHRSVTAALDEALRPSALNRTMYLILVTLALSRRGERPLSYLTRYLMVHPTTVTQTVDEMERRGWLRRVPHPTDRRTTLAALLPAGRAVMESATAAAAARGFGLGALDEQTLRSLTDSLQRVRRATGDLP